MPTRCVHEHLNTWVCSLIHVVRVLQDCARWHNLVPASLCATWLAEVAWCGLCRPTDLWEIMDEYLTPSSRTISRNSPHKDDLKDTESDPGNGLLCEHLWSSCPFTDTFFLLFPSGEVLWAPEDKWPVGNTQEDNDGQGPTAAHLPQHQWASLMPATGCSSLPTAPSPAFDKRLLLPVMCEEITFQISRAWWHMPFISVL